MPLVKLSLWVLQFVLNVHLLDCVISPKGLCYKSGVSFLSSGVTSWALMKWTYHLWDDPGFKEAALG